MTHHSVHHDVPLWYVAIPNSVVKRFSGDDNELARACENTSLPGLIRFIKYMMERVISELGNPYLPLVDQVEIFNTETGQGNPEVLGSFKAFVLENALKVLRLNPKDRLARKAIMWAVNPDPEKVIDFNVLKVTFQQAGLYTESWVIRLDKIPE